MTAYFQPSFFDLSDRYEQLSAGGDPLVKINEIVDWKLFMPLLSRAFDKARKSEAGRKPYNRVMMFKLLILQSLYNLSDHQVEFQVRDRLSFMRFLGLELGDKVPDEKTIWLFREVLVQSSMIEKLFKKFDQYLESKGFAARVGSIVDASIVEAPRQRNSRDENKEIKAGKTPESFETNVYKMRQKDVDARWTKKLGEVYYGYKDHVRVDVKHKLIRDYEVTAASSADINSLLSLLREEDGNEAKLWADSAYCSEETAKTLKEKGWTNRIISKFHRVECIGSPIDRENRRRAKVRKRVEHVFGFMENSMGGKIVRTIGIVRAKAKIGLMNLGYNICRYEQLCRLGAS